MGEDFTNLETHHLLLQVMLCFFWCSASHDVLGCAHVLVFHTRILSPSSSSSLRLLVPLDLTLHPRSSLPRLLPLPPGDLSGDDAVVIRLAQHRISEPIKDGSDEDDSESDEDDSDDSMEEDELGCTGGSSIQLYLIFSLLSISRIFPSFSSPPICSSTKPNFLSDKPILVEKKPKENMPFRLRLSVTISSRRTQTASNCRIATSNHPLRAGSSAATLSSLLPSHLRRHHQRRTQLLHLGILLLLLHLLPPHRPIHPTTSAARGASSPPPCRRRGILVCRRSR